MRGDCKRGITHCQGATGLYQTSPMALKCLKRPSTRLLQRGYCTIDSPSLLNSGPSRTSYTRASTPSFPPSTRSFISVSSTAYVVRCSDTSLPPSTRSWNPHSIRTISSSAIRSATPQEAHGSSITASYIASAGELELVDVKKVLVIGSGGLSIGQAGEFDYSGARQFAVTPMPIC